MIKEKFSMGICTAPSASASNLPISNLIDIIKPLSKDVVLITGNASYIAFKNDPRVICYGINYPMQSNLLVSVKNYIFTQLWVSYTIVKNTNKVDLWFFFMGGERQCLPIVVAKILKKPTFLVLTGSIIKSALYSHDPFFTPIKIFNWISSNLVSGIIVYSHQLIHDACLEQYRKKIFIAHRHFVDLNAFEQTLDYDDRPNLIGYIGRLSEEKGVLNFVNSFLKIQAKNPKIHFFIGGDGILRDKVTTIISSSGLKERITCVGWIPHNELPRYLNNLRLLVIPSYTEGLPNIMLEAMACGTPVLVAPVGAIPDVIHDEETGFFLRDNSPEQIADSVIYALNHPHLKEIAYDGKQLIFSKFSFQKAVDSYAVILSNFYQMKTK